jgi:hypothetical protein
MPTALIVIADPDVLFRVKLKLIDWPVAGLAAGLETFETDKTLLIEVVGPNQVLKYHQKLRFP